MSYDTGASQPGMDGLQVSGNVGIGRYTAIVAGRIFGGDRHRKEPFGSASRTVRPGFKERESSVKKVFADGNSCTTANAGAKF